MTIPLSILDLAPIRKGETTGESFAASVALAERAEHWGYQRSGTPSITTWPQSRPRPPA